jgi:hypothetical protein
MILAEIPSKVNTQKKTEPPVNQAAPSPFAVHSVQPNDELCQLSNQRTENGEPVIGLPRLPSLPLPAPEQPPSSAQQPPLGKDYDLSNPPQSQILAAFKMLKPLHRLYIDDFVSGNPVLNHGSSGWPHRAAFCYDRVLPSHFGVELRRSLENEHSVGLGQVVRCDNVHLCPVCGLFAALRWQKDIKAVEDQLKADGYRLLLFVLTISHSRDDTLESELNILRSAYGELFGTQKKSQKKRNARWGISGRLRAWDVLYGVNGWHAHVNVIVAIRPDQEHFLIEEIFEEYDRLYRQFIYDAGGFASMDHGLKVEEYKNGKCYVLKTGMEHIECRKVGDRWSLAQEAVSTAGKTSAGANIGELRAMLVGDVALSIDGDRVRSSRRLPVALVRSLVLEYGATMSGERMVVTGGVIRERLRDIRNGATDDSYETEMIPAGERYTIDGVIPAQVYHQVVIGENRIVDLIAALRQSKERVTEYLLSIGIELDARDISRELYHQDCIQIVDEREKARVMERLDREFERWSILNVDTFTSELDEFL